MAKEKTQEIEALDLKSFDIVESRQHGLLQLFPEIRTEGMKIDLEKLKLALGDMVEGGRERYGIVWPGKSQCYKTIQAPGYGTLRPNPEKSLEFEHAENLFIEGDNLEVLRLLQKAYLGAVKLIYIDPPYNTGNDFIYPDDFSESLQTYLTYTGQIDFEGRKFGTNAETDGRFHSKWLNMMYPRLFLARNLLRDDGFILISIDDHEVTNLRMICNEIFGEENFVGSFVWKRRQVADNRNVNQVSTDHEYVVCYSRSQSMFAGTAKDESKYSNPDNDPRGPWMSDNLTGLASKEERPNLHYVIVDPKSGNKYPPHPARGWAYEPSRMQQMIAEGRILFPKDPEGRPRLKRFWKEVKSQTTGFSTIPEDVGYTTNGTRELDELFGKKVFPFPKPTALIEALLRQTTSAHGGDIVLDFFAGSCTTAHAVLKLNHEDGGNRKFICVQLPEPCKENAEAKSLGLDTIADIGRERILRVIRKLKETPTLNTAEAIEGFRTFFLDSSNFKAWQSEPQTELIKQLELHIDHVLGDRSQSDILFEILMKSGFRLDTQIEHKKLGKQTVHSVAGGMLLVCLEKDISLDLIKYIADQKPERVVCLDQGFANNDQLKANAVQIFKTKGVASFKTV